jgi:hypothetical protein
VSPNVPPRSNAQVKTKTVPTISIPPSPSPPIDATSAHLLIEHEKEAPSATGESLAELVIEHRDDPDASGLDPLDASSVDNGDTSASDRGDASGRADGDGQDVDVAKSLKDLFTPTEANARTLLALQGLAFNARLGRGDPDKWQWTEAELDLVAPSAAKLAKRSKVATKVFKQSDAAAVVGGAAVYVLRNLGIIPDLSAFAEEEVDDDDTRGVFEEAQPVASGSDERPAAPGHFGPAAQARSRSYP